MQVKSMNNKLEHDRHDLTRLHTDELSKQAARIICRVFRFQIFTFATMGLLCAVLGVISNVTF